MSIDEIKENYQKVQDQIALIKNADPQIVAVTKYIEADLMEDMYEAGFRKFGENRADELIKKQERLDQGDIEWHFVGHLQRRPVKKIINRIDYLHSLDRLSLAQEIQKRADQPVKCFLQVNISGEASKSGISLEELADFLEEVQTYDRIQVVGLMTMAPHEASEDQVRDIFNQLKEARDQVASEKLSYAPCTELSMGMSGDYRIAVEEGATYLRLGRILYGEL